MTIYSLPIWRASAILDLLCGWLDHPRRSFGGPYHFTKFGWNRRSSFDNISILRVWHENAFSRPFSFFWAHFPQIMSLIILTPARTVLGWNHVIWAIKHEYRPRGSSSALKREKRTGQDRTGKKSQKGYISPIWGEAPTEAIYIKNCIVGDVVDVSTRAKLGMKFSGVTILQGVECCIFLSIFVWALQQCSASALPAMISLSKLQAYCEPGIYTASQKSSHLLTVCNFVKP